jgi:6,7-dimethyl-8-ribityllumazine synthase
MKKILVIQAPFYQHISQLLLEGATKKLAELGFEFDVIDVMGALEIAPAISIAKDSKKYCAYVALGCVIRGETTHYDYVCTESARGLSNLAINYKLPIGNGILTVENEAQAIARADIKQKDKGGFAVLAAISMLKIKENFEVS